MWYALQTSLSLEQEPHYWQEKSMGFQGAIFRRNVCLKLIICLMSFLSICLCPGFENTALNVGLYVALLMCAADLWGSPLAMKGCLHLHSWQTCSLGEGRQRKGTRPYKWSWFILALVQWGSFAGSGGMERPTALLQGWEKGECCSLPSAEPALERSCVRGDAAGPCWPEGSACGSGGLGAKGCAEHG